MFRLSRSISVVLITVALTPLAFTQEAKRIVPITPGRKVALVIGNSSYAHYEPIPAAANDADDVAANLRALGFTAVTVRKNLGIVPLITEIAQFGNSLREGDLAVLYYSGHGGSIGEENYLLPVDYEPPAAEDLVERSAYKMSKARDAMERSGALVRVLIFDACRSSLLSGVKGGDSAPRPIEGRPEGTLIAFASAHKQEALFDARNRNSIFTGRLLAGLKAQGADFRGMLEDVSRQVFLDTNRRQIPYLYGFLSGPLYLAGPAPVAPAIPKIDAAAETWAMIRNSQNAEDFDDFARSFPSSELATGAKVRAAQLRRAAAATEPTPPRAETLQTGVSKKVNPKDGLTYVWIGPGSFTMGCSPGDSECFDNEKPAKQVSISTGFWIGQTDVTQEAYQRVVGSNPSYFKGPKLPVENVNWTEAQNYCQATGMRLPTEAEWEYAARAGSTGSRYGDLDRIAWYDKNSGSKTHDVAAKEPNAWGLYDMLGSVWQWTADWYEKDKTRTLRGGSWVNNPRVVRVSGRGRGEPGVRSYIVGARCVGN